MKIIALIMAFLMLVLPVLPCADDDHAPAAGEPIVKQDKQQEEQEHNDACSPFCHCTCCAGLSMHHLVATVSCISLIDSKSYTSCLQGDLVEHSVPVWQPPQLNA